MSTNNTNNNGVIDTATAAEMSATIAAPSTVTPETHGGLNAADIETAEGRQNHDPIVAYVRKGEIATDKAVALNGYASIFKAFKDMTNKPEWFEEYHISRFAFRSGARAARRVNGQNEASVGRVAIVSYVPTALEGDAKTGKWHLLAELLEKSGVAVPLAVNLATAKKVQKVFNKIFCSGVAPKEAVKVEKKKEVKKSDLLVEIAALRAELAAALKANEKKA